MKRKPSFRKEPVIPAVGLWVHILLSLLLITTVLSGGPSTARPLFLVTVAASVVWGQRLSSAFRRNGSGTSPLPADGNSALRTILRRLADVKAVLSKLCGVLFRPATMFLFLLCAVDGYTGFLPLKKTVTFPVTLHLIMLTTGTVLSVTAAIFFMKLSRGAGYRILRIPALHTVCIAALFFVPLTELLLRKLFYVNYPAVLRTVPFLYAALMGAEMAAGYLGTVFLPSRTGPTTDPFSSYFLSVISDPLRTGQTTRDMLGELFGFDIARIPVFRSFFPVIPLFLLLSALIMLAVTAIVIISPGMQGVLLTFGKPAEKVLGEGLHWKAPWPAGTVVIAGTDSVRTIHVGSHHTATEDGNVLKAGVPLLWTNLHGITDEELLMLAAPKALIRDAHESGAKIDRSDRRVPSISLAGADITVEYTIRDLKSFVTGCSKPDDYMRLLSEQCVSMMLFRYEIEELFSRKRTELAALMRDSIQNRCDNRGLGVNVLHVGITAVHPPRAVAAAFEEKISAYQEQETKIQQAQQISLKNRIETAGTVDNFERLMRLIEAEEHGVSTELPETERLMLECGGEVARILAEAEGYRWSMENTEGAKAERFAGRAAVYRLAPRIFKNDLYLAILGKQLSEKRKIILFKGHKNVTIAAGFAEDLRGQQPVKALGIQ